MSIKIMVKKNRKGIDTLPLRDVLKDDFSEIEWDAPLAPHTSLKVGGPADVMVYPRTVEELSRLMKTLSKHHLPYFILGNGSNLLIKDGGISGVVIHLQHLNGIILFDRNILQSEAGLPYPKLAVYAMEHGLTGLEFAAGIPGTVGGAVVMNAGIPNLETAPRLDQMTLVDESGRLHDLPAKAITFDYRKANLPKGIIVSATFALSPAPKAEIAERMKAYLKRRQETQPLNFSNCGSVFKNPRGHHAGALIESVGLKGCRIGDAEISDRHANFIINRGAATAADCIALIKKMKETVADSNGISLELEVKIVGRD